MGHRSTGAQLSWALSSLLLLACTAGCGDDAGGVDSGSPPDAGGRDASPGDASPRDGSVSRDARVTDSSRPDATIRDASADAPVTPCRGLLVDSLDSPTDVPSPASGVPSAGAPFTIAETGVELTRISDVSDPSATASDYTNGYSRFSPANITGEYVAAFGTDGSTAIYRLADRSIVRNLDVGEANELRWDGSGTGGTATRLYYRRGAALRRVDALTGTDELVHDFSVEYPSANVAINGAEGAASNDMRYWAFQICAGMTSGGQCTGLQDIVVYDLETDTLTGRLSDREASIPTPNFVDISPSGSRIVVGSCKENGSTPAPWNGPYAWSLDFSTRVRLGTNCSHSGWAWGDAGEELYVSYDSCGAGNEEVTRTCDNLMAVDVNDAAGWDNRVGILYQGDLGWGNSTHIGRIRDPRVRGWLLLSTYGDGGNAWSHQLMMVRIAPASAGPRLLRIAPTITRDDGYWTEAFASVDFGAGYVYWGSNWDGASNLELYRARLCDGWWTSAL
ncbi:MAG: hypothetical protein GXP55_09495 [Deltaproteobacteria bacterium]|nr:hypothetical protein [Deltaproteobacteria bacterium]